MNDQIQPTGEVTDESANPIAFAETHGHRGDIRWKYVPRESVWHDDHHSIVLGRGVDGKGDRFYRLVRKIAGTTDHVTDWVAESELTHFNDPSMHTRRVALHTRRAVESMRLGPTLEVPGGHAAGGSYSPPDSSEGYAGEEGD